MGNQHHRTPKKSNVLGTISFLEKEKIPHFKSRVFEHFGVSNRQGWEIVRQRRNRRNLQDDPDNPDLEETRGRKRILSPADLRAMEKLIWKYGFEARALTWQALAYEAGVAAEVSWRTIQRAMGTFGYRKCVACRKGCVSPATAKRRLNAATIALRERPTPQHWRDIRWSDEVHFSLGPEGRIMIIRKSGERHCPDCIQETRAPEPKHLKRLHAWAAIGWNFKSDLHFYEVPGNSNGKMSMQIYRDDILEKAVSPWLARGDQFVLEEDGDSRHGTGKNNIVRDWKQQHGLKYFCNTPGSPDLSPIENGWNVVKQDNQPLGRFNGPTDAGCSCRRGKNDRPLSDLQMYIKMYSN
ncbi:hypothetical protein N658DRAFT_74700 [Parathielavia hyrcaniae]|uniref:Tc1-like transposase DDE domain-containing protein n=1 Tax=Parathielavia hyrcaniae TaxID=113614 RepID=A0AAN6T0U2_9PEZI|nr:hypothetical protein N658DRAFT_74700 [Parathielavia hyrcaniae]